MREEEGRKKTTEGEGGKEVKRRKVFLKSVLIFVACTVCRF